MGLRGEKLCLWGVPRKYQRHFGSGQTADLKSVAKNDGDAIGGGSVVADVKASEKSQRRIRLCDSDIVYSLLGNENKSGSGNDDDVDLSP